VILVHFSLEARRVDGQESYAELAILGDVLLEPFGRHVGAPFVEELAVVINVERVDEADLADGNSGLGGSLALLEVHPRKRVADSHRVLDPRRDIDFAERLLVERLLEDGAAPDFRRRVTGEERRASGDDQRAGEDFQFEFRHFSPAWPACIRSGVGKLGSFCKAGSAGTPWQKPAAPTGSARIVDAFVAPPQRISPLIRDRRRASASTIRSLPDSPKNDETRTQ
jgi:hypothetical protein